MTTEISEFLLSAQSPHEKVRTDAEARILQLQKNDLPQLLLSLSLQLSNDKNSLETRILAGTMLNGLLDATTKSKWVSIDISVKNKIKALLLNTLGSSVSEAGHTAAQLIANIASIEIPNKEWPELFARLLDNMSHKDNPPLKQATLKSLGYVCEKICHNDLTQDEVNLVLKVVVQRTYVAETEQSSVRLAAATALYNVLTFAHENFKNERERTYIMTVVCDAAVAKEANIRKAAFECFVLIASTYYKVLEPYMAYLFKLTTDAFKDEETVALQAIKFWSSICDEEIKLTRNSHNHFCFIETTKIVLVPVLLETILKQAKKDEDEKILLKAVGVCLGLVARVVGDSIVSLVILFVHENLSTSDWWSRVVGAYVFVSILEGPSVEKLSPKVSQVVKLLPFAIKDQGSAVKGTAAWTLSRIFRYLHSSGTGFSVISPTDLERVIQVLLESIKDLSSDVAEKACGAIYYFAQGYEGLKSGSSGLTLYLDEIITSLIRTFDRTDMKDWKLRSAASAALKEVVRCSNLSESSPTIITQLLNTVIFKINRYHSLVGRKKQGDLLTLLCGVLLVIIRKLGSRDETKPSIVQEADKIMLLLNKNLPEPALHPSVNTAIFSCFGEMALAIGKDFVQYVDGVMDSMRVAMEFCAKIDVNDEKLVQNGNELKMSIFEAYSGIWQMLKKSDAMLCHVPQLLKFIEVVVKNAHSDELEKAALALLRDLANALPDISVFNLKMGSRKRHQLGPKE